MTSTLTLAPASPLPSPPPQPPPPPSPSPFTLLLAPPQASRHSGRGYLLKGKAQLQLCAFDEAMVTFQQASSSSSRGRPWPPSNRYVQPQPQPSPLAPTPTLTPTLTSQQGCKADPADKLLREAWFGAKNVCKAFRSAARLKHGGEAARALAFEAARQPSLHALRQLPEACDRATCYANLAAIHARWLRHAEASTRPDLLYSYLLSVY